MKLILTVDFGSTYTKIAAFDLANKKLISTVQAKTTVESDITVGLKNAISKLEYSICADFTVDKILASSSAAGGLQMIAIGLTRPLTTKAAQEAVLGAGAKLVS